MSEAFPELLDPRRAVDQEARFAGDLPLSGFPRLAPMLAARDGMATYRLAFGKDHRGQGIVRGHVSAELTVRCQRCNGMLSLTVESPLSLALVEGLDEAATVPEEYDPLLLEGRLLHPADLIEDELILAVPAGPRHEAGSCEAPAADADHGHGDGATEERRNPCAELAALQRDRGRTH